METRVRVPVTERAPVPKGPKHRARPRRRPMAAGHVLVAFAVCMLVWAFLDADALKRSSEASPDGTRRTASLAFLRPLSAISNALFIGHLGNAIQRALGRNPEAAPGTGSTTVHIGAAPKANPTSGPGGSGTPASRPTPSGHGTPQRSVPPSKGASIPPLRVPTHDDPLRVLVVGDSFATDVGYGLGRSFNLYVVSLNLQGVISSGLARPDFYDWPAKLRQDVDRLDPDLVVVMIGGNDFHSVLLPNGHSISFHSGKVWRRAYRARVVSFLREATSRGARVAWVGLPVMRDKNYATDVRRLNSVYEQVVGRNPEAVYIDSWHLFTDKHGHYAAYLPDENGDLEPVRTADNIHLSPQGNDRLAGYVTKILEKTWDLPRKAVAH